MTSEIKYKFAGGENQFNFQCDSCGTLTEEGKACPRCNHSVIRVYAKPQLEGMEALLRA